MTLRTFLEQLNKFAQENPSALEMKVVTSKDDEGNGFNPVNYGPSIGLYRDREFISIDQFPDYEIGSDDSNAVCVN